MAKKPKEKPEEKKEKKSTKNIFQLLQEMGEEVNVNEELMRSGGLTIVGARMPPKDAPPPPPTPEKPT